MPASAISHSRRPSGENGLVSALNEIEESQIPKMVGMMCFIIEPISESLFDHDLSGRDELKKYSTSNPIWGAERGKNFIVIRISVCSFELNLNGFIY
jgi:hypothetical protein